MNTSSLERAFSWSNTAYIAGVVLAAAATIFIYFFASRLTAAKDAELRRFKDESAKAIAEAIASAARADEGTAKANERTGVLGVEAARQRERAAKAELALLELQQRIAPRRLTGHQRLSEAGWRPAELNQIIGTTFSGVRLNIRSIAGAPPQAVALLRALQAAGISVVSGPDASIPEGTVQLAIGSKPE